MKKYQINKDFNLVSLLTFPVIPAVAPIAEMVLGMLVYPVLDCQMKTQSAKKYTDTPVWNAKLNRKMWQLYLNGNSEVDEYASPSLSNDLTDMPKTYIETAEFDCLSDEGKEYAKMLLQSGCEVELFNTNSTMHGFDMASKSKIVIKSIGKRCDFLRKSFK